MEWQVTNTTFCCFFQCGKEHNTQLFKNSHTGSEWHWGWVNESFIKKFVLLNKQSFNIMDEKQDGNEKTGSDIRWRGSMEDIQSCPYAFLSQDPIHILTGELFISAGWFMHHTLHCLCYNGCTKWSFHQACISVCAWSWFYHPQWKQRLFNHQQMYLRVRESWKVLYQQATSEGAQPLPRRSIILQK